MIRYVTFSILFCIAIVLIIGEPTNADSFGKFIADMLMSKSAGIGIGYLALKLWA